MAPKTLDFNCAIITGGGGGLGLTMAKWIVSQGKSVIIAGRTESKLQDASKKLSNCPYYVLDTGSIPDIAPFCKRVIQEHPEVDCLINNAGVQRPLFLTDFDLAKADQEISININGPVHLVIGFLNHFKSKKAATIINVSSSLGYAPIMLMNPIYNGTKAFVHYWTTNLRTQLATKEESKHIKVVEIAPPSVGTDLHRDHEDPDDNKKEKNKEALTTEEFMKDVEKGWKEDEDVVAPGMSRGLVDKWYDAYGEAYQAAEKAGKGL